MFFAPEMPPTVPAAIVEIHQSVNAAHIGGEPLPVNAFDRDGDGKYDCENYAIEKMGKLAAKGIVAKLVFGISGRVPALHAVAVTSDGYVLDNLNKNIWTTEQNVKMKLFTPGHYEINAKGKKKFVEDLTWKSEDLWTATSVWPQDVTTATVAK